MKPLTAVAAALLVALLLGCSAPMQAEVNKPAPDFTLKDLSGKDVSLKDLDGKVVLLDFWATWCPPCREEIPGFVELEKQFGEQGLSVIGVAVDADAEGKPDVQRIRQFVQDFKVSYPVVLSEQQVEAAYGALTREGRIPGIPTTFLLDRRHNVVKYFLGYHPLSAFEQDVKALLSQEK